MGSFDYFQHVVRHAHYEHAHRGLLKYLLQQLLLRLALAPG
jgi:hypothetical protein